AQMGGCFGGARGAFFVKIPGGARPGRGAPAGGRGLFTTKNSAATRRGESRGRGLFTTTNSGEAGRGSMRESPGRSTLKSLYLLPVTMSEQRKHIEELLHRALQLEWLSPEEGVFLFENADTAELMYVGHRLRLHHRPDNVVSWIIDRNSNTTNVCIANCKFCNFYRRPGHEEAYVTSLEEYREKIEETFRYGGEQLLLQGRHH